jgi:hypothetical protein
MIIATRSALGRISAFGVVPGCGNERKTCPKDALPGRNVGSAYCRGHANIRFIGCNPAAGLAGEFHGS